MRGRELKLSKMLHGHFDFESPLMRGRELKPYWPLSSGLDSKSPLMRGRELKQCPGLQFRGSPARVAPYAGA